MGATSVSGIIRPLPPVGTDERENADGIANTQFVSRTYTNQSSGCSDDTDESKSLCEFDDLVMWLSSALLNNRMVVSGRLP